MAGIRDRGILTLAALILFLLCYPLELAAQSRGSVKGRLTDAQSGEPLMFANIALIGTTSGTVTDSEGNYQLNNIKPGTYTLLFSYIGYAGLEQEITIGGGESKVIDASLSVESIMGEEVVVTAMMRGQTAAISQQVNSSTIVNVVSKEKIMELPDQNAAETVARLPGVSLVRDGGEGTKVTLRGMAPRFNSITIDGEKIPSTSDQDRSVDLSMFSTDALAGIEFYKALLPDMDADAIGDKSISPHERLREDFMAMPGCRPDTTRWIKALDSTRHLPRSKTAFSGTDWGSLWGEACSGPTGAPKDLRVVLPQNRARTPMAIPFLR